MKAVMLSIKPKWCELIANGKKTVEVRKTKPKIEMPFKCYIYCSKTGIFLEQSKTNPALQKNVIDKYGGKVIGEFVCRLITGLRANNGIQTYYNGTQGTCLTDKEIIDYAKGKMIYYWHIFDLKIYDKPKELSEFIRPDSCPYAVDECETCKTHTCFTRPPQSWCYVEMDGNEL